MSETDKNKSQPLEEARGKKPPPDLRKPPPPPPPPPNSPPFLSIRDWKKISVPFSSKVPGTFWPMSNTWTWPTSSSSRFSEGWMKPRLAGTWRARLLRWGGVELQPWRSLLAFRGREYSAGSENSRKANYLQRTAFAEFVAVASAWS